MTENREIWLPKQAFFQAHQGNAASIEGHAGFVDLACIHLQASSICIAKPERAGLPAKQCARPAGIADQDRRGSPGRR